MKRTVTGRTQLEIRPTPSQRFHDWLALAAARLLGRVGPERAVLRASGFGLGQHGIMIGEYFTDPLTFRKYYCTRIEWTDLEDGTLSVATVYGREIR